MAQKNEWVVGIHAVSELLKQQPASVQRLVFQSGRDDARLGEIKQLVAELGLRTEVLDKRDIDRSAGGTHQGVAAWVKFVDVTKDERFLKKLLDDLDHEPLLLVLDGITDPHNLGACLRTADAAGVDAVIVPKDRSASINTTVRKVACGAGETVNFVGVTNLQRCLQTLKQRGIWMVGAAGEAQQGIHQQSLTGPLALVMGSEDKGLRRLTRESCDFLVSIPMAGALSSLNVSVATGICLFEAIRQRSKD
ncbi:MAG: 23S rRNA (guanosine(2251)-2'-O)-methyltransferase RlmB [SAR86 cluster bacterium]|uniref:23S rRNA (guanosine-2'-O-)-methyltransferase RlmB n=1 Tax=SAR86 cluster bacterium TaxID=2030880 RepID=A0A2A4MR81_9GAMM|nr:MAG: 23S rRNA (guanosine(2251)-2'-O)-methyltransferase RlmB [SAR86 cluster bacterium]